MEDNMNIQEQIILRKYIKRKIAGKNTIFAKMTSGFKQSAKTLRWDVFEAFACGRHSSNAFTSSRSDLRDARDHIFFHNTNMSPYNYFDLDSLIAYDSFLDQVLNEASISRMQDRRKMFEPKDISRAIKNTLNKFVAEAGTFATGYYDDDHPLTIMRDEDKTPIFEKTPDARSFEQKYPLSYCDRLYMDYLEEKYPTHEEIKPSREIGEVFDFIYAGDKYITRSEEYYLDTNQYPIRYIIADSLKKDKELRGFFDLSMREYVGDVFDLDHNYKYSSEETGVDVYDEQDHIQ